MFLAFILFLVAPVGQVLGKDNCLCTNADLVVRVSPSHTASPIAVLRGGTCLNDTEYEQIDQWIEVHVGKSEPGFIFNSEDLQHGRCKDILRPRRKHNCDYCDGCCHSSGHHHHHSDCSYCNDCCDGSSNNNGHTDNSIWTVWDLCSVTCGTGTQSRHCVENCDHISQTVQTQGCQQSSCTYTPEWSDWTDCSASCGQGTKSRYCRHHCSQVHSPETVACNRGECPAEWSEWTKCSVTCGDGTRTKHCVNNCHGVHPTTQTENCHEQACPAEWSAWTKCSVTCGDGTRTKHCVNNCHGVHPTTHTENCHEQACPVIHSCNKFRVIQSLAEINTTAKVQCSNRFDSGTEKYLLNHCNNTPAPIHWQRGVQVAVDCKGAQTIPSYSPIGTFWHGDYKQSEVYPGVSGVFLGCTQNGFKMATEACGGGAEIIHIPNEANERLHADAFISNDPLVYYTITW